MSFDVQIFGNSVAFRSNSLHITTKTGNQRATCDFTMDDWGEEGAAYVPKVGQIIEVFEDAVLRFAGTIDQLDIRLMGNIPHDTEGKVWDVTCIDYNAFADRHRVRPQVWIDTPLGQIFAEIADAGLTPDGVDPSTNVVIDPTVRATFEVKAEYPSCGEVFDQLVALASSISGVQYYWLINLTLAAFFAPTAAASPEMVFDGTTIRDDPNPPKMTITREQYANRVILILADSIGDSVTEIFDSSSPTSQPVDGSRTSWDMAKPLAAEPTITVDNTGLSPAGEIEPQTVGILDVETGKQWYWQKGSSTITQATASPSVPLDAPQVLSVTYRPQQENVVEVEDAAAILERQTVEGGSGIYEVVLTFSDFATIAAGLVVAQAELDRRKSLSVVFTFQTMETEIKPGETAYLDIPYFSYGGGIFDAPGEYFVRSVKMHDEERTVLWREIEAVRGPIVMDSLEFFRTLLGGTSRVNESAIAADSSIMITVSY